MGRSNVGKSSLINALVRQRIARTSARPGKTRLANVFRVRRGGTAAPFYLVDLPGYGYVHGGSADFAGLVGEYFGARGHPSEREAPGAREVSASGGGAPRADKKSGALAPAKTVGALLLVDARHPGLESDRTAWQWIQTAAESATIVAAKIDKLTRGERNRALRAIESVFEHPVLPVSAATGEGLEELWKLIDRLANSRNPQRRRNSRPRKTMAPSPPRK